MQKLVDDEAKHTQKEVDNEVNKTEFISKVAARKVIRQRLLEVSAEQKREWDKTIFNSLKDNYLMTEIFQKDSRTESKTNLIKKNDCQDNKIDLLQKKNCLDSKTDLMQQEKECYKKSVCIYNALQSEVATESIIDLCLQNCNVYLPVVQNDDILLVKIDKNTEYRKGAWGIFEPIGQKILPQEIALDICITPLLAFDKMCNRLGKGKGYYDRFFANNNCKKIGLAYECQHLENFEKENTDIQMDCVVTQQEIYTNGLRNYATRNL